MNNKDSELIFIDPHELVGFIPDSDIDKAGNTDEDSESAIEEETLKYASTLIESSEDYVFRSQENTRGRLAIIYTLATFLIFLIVIIAAVIDGLARKTSIIDNLTVILPLISGFFLGSLGFVIGYYFRKEREK